SARAPGERLARRKNCSSRRSPLSLASRRRSDLGTMSQSDPPKEHSWIRKADALIGIAAAPAFAEIRNLLVPLGQNLDLARLAARELRTASEQLVEDTPILPDPVGTWVEAGRATSDELVTLLGELEMVSERLQASI